MAGMSAQRIPSKVPGFHDYHSNLMECIDWCMDEQRRQTDMWTRIRPRAMRANMDPSWQVWQDFVRVTQDQQRINEQLDRAVNENQKIQPVYMLIRLLIRKGQLLTDLDNLIQS